MAEESPKRSWLRRLLNWLEVDRAVFYAVGVRVWQLGAGPITMLLIAFFFRPQIQGYFYTFWTLLALQTVVEMGFHVVIVSAASHEWSRLELSQAGVIVGDESARSRLISLGQLVLRWYAAAAVVFVIGVGISGAVLLHQNEEGLIDWEQPWLAVVLLTGLLVWLSPFNALLEGCNQVIPINRFRLIQAVAGNIAVWVCIPLGAELWTVAAACCVRLACEVCLIFGSYRHFFLPFFHRISGDRINWLVEIWPMQWQLALRATTFYFVSHAITLLMFHYHGSVIAGQMGMTWTVLSALQLAATAWIQTRAPRFGMLIAERNYSELDRIYKRLTVISVCVLVLACTAFCLATVALNWLESPYAQRLLPPMPTVIFSLVVTLGQISACQWIYIHAHKRTAYTGLAVGASCVQILLIWCLGAWYGPTGAGIARLSMTVLFILPVWTWVWWRCRKEWHSTN